MDEHEWLADRFEEHRVHLRAVAYRMLGSLAEADDAVQDTWLRVARAGASDVENLGGCVMAIPILVTGGTGTLGTAGRRSAGDAGCDVLRSAGAATPAAMASSS
ncbi:MAG TPA: sigma factor [Euzebyales bacterium]|nr:sigma factor [Euzebyales bacterium]